MLHSLQDPTIEDFFLSWWELQSCKVLYPPWGEEQGERNGLLWARRHINVPDERLPSSSPLISFRSFCACSTASSYQFMPLSHHCEEVATDLAPDPWTLGQVRKLWVGFLFLLEVPLWKILRSSWCFSPSALQVFGGILPSGSLFVSQTGSEDMGTWPNSATYYPGDFWQAIVGFGL